MLAAPILCVAASSCQKDDVASAPRIPSIETLRIDFSAIPSTKAGYHDKEYAELVDVLENVWNHIYDHVVDVPLRGLEIVADARPVRDGHLWTWKVSDNDFLGRTYEVTLTGREHGSKVDWALSVSRNGFGGFQNYTWITGWSKKDGSEGQWSVSVGPDDLDLLVTSDWKVKDGSVSSCRLTYNLSHALGTIGAFFNGSYIEYFKGASDNAYTDTLQMCYYQLGHIAVDATVEWNSRTRACRFKRGQSENWVEFR